MLRDDRILPLTKILLLPLSIASAIFGPLLFFLPTRTDTLFAWTITPPMSAVFVGASYIFGALTIWHLIWNGRWHPMRIALIGTWSFSAAMLIATLLHWDRFHQGTLLFYGWFAIYVMVPILLPVGYWLNSRRDPGIAATDLQVAQPIRLVMAGVGLLYTLLGLVMLVSPTALAAQWPWQLTPLMSRVIGGWFLLPGGAALAAYIEPRWSAYRVVFVDAIVWMALLLIGSLMHLGDFNFGRPLSYVWFIALAAGIALTVWLYLSHERRLATTANRSPGRPLPTA